MTVSELKLLIRQKLVARRTITQEIEVLDTLIDFITQSVTSGIPEWDFNITFNADGSGAGAFCTYMDISGALRFWNSKTNGNINHAPPNTPSETENTYWEEVSPAAGSAIKAYEPGLIGEGLFICYYNDGQPALYVLKDDVTRPFNSVDLLAELAEDKWEKLGGASGWPLSGEGELTGDVFIFADGEKGISFGYDELWGDAPIKFFDVNALNDDSYIFFGAKSTLDNEGQLSIDPGGVSVYSGGETRYGAMSAGEDGAVLEAGDFYGDLQTLIQVMSDEVEASIKMSAINNDTETQKSLTITDTYFELIGIEENALATKVLGLDDNDQLCWITQVPDDGELSEDQFTYSPMTGTDGVYGVYFGAFYDEIEEEIDRDNGVLRNFFVKAVGEDPSGEETIHLEALYYGLDTVIDAVDIIDFGGTGGLHLEQRGFYPSDPANTTYNRTSSVSIGLSQIYLDNRYNGTGTDNRNSYLHLNTHSVEIFMTDGINTAGFDISEDEITISGEINFDDLTANAIVAESPTHVVVFNIGNVPYKFFVTPA